MQEIEELEDIYYALLDKQYLEPEKKERIDRALDSLENHIGDYT